MGRCGITFEKFQDIKEGDIIEAYLMEQIEVSQIDLTQRQGGRFRPPCFD